MIHVVRNLILNNSLLLLAGTLAGFAWANLNSESYLALVELHLFSLGHHEITLRKLINDIFMTLFFAQAGKEIFEAFLPNGALSDRKKASLPLIGTLGGMIGPVIVYLSLSTALGTPHLLHGWAIPTATDIAFSALVARMIFGKNHPAVTFLLVLAIADDAGGLIILALFYSQAINVPILTSLVTLALMLAMFMNRVCAITSWPLYIFGPGVVSWCGFFFGGLEPALALVPIIFLMPHAHDDRGLFVDEEDSRTDSLNRFEHQTMWPVHIILMCFGFLNTGVVFSVTTLFTPATLLVSMGLLIGKPLGITLATLAGMKAGLVLPAGMSKRHVLTNGVAASIGFTVALFVAGVALPTGADLDGAKMGAVLSFSGFFLAIATAKLFGIKPTKSQ